MLADAKGEAINSSAQFEDLMNALKVIVAVAELTG